MKQIAFSRGSPAGVVEVPAPALKAGAVLVRTSYSAISVGTERQAAALGSMSLFAKARQKPEQVAKVVRGVLKDGFVSTYKRAKDALAEWMPGGYSNAGVVVAVGESVHGIRVGDAVACGGGGHAVHADYCVVPQRLIARVPEGVLLEDAAFATIGAVAMHGFRVGDVALGENVAVIGLGIVGQMLCQIAAAAGARVIPMDLDESRVALAASILHQEGVCVGSGIEAAEVAALTDQRGADVVFVCVATSRSDPMQLAMSIARDRGRLVVVGEVGMQLDRQSLYEKELEVRISRSYGPGRYDPSYEQRGHDYPFPYVRWTEQRNIASVVDLIARGKLHVKPLVTHRYPIHEAERAFRELTTDSQQRPIGALFEYSHATPGPPANARLLLTRSSSSPPAGTRLALIGPGAFAKNVILPALQKQGVAPIAIASSSSLAPTQVAAKVAAEYATTAVADVFADESIDAVFIATRHNSHGALVVQALNAGKNVFVEKPLAMTSAELERICEAYNQSQRSVMVGFNRRFAPFVRRMIRFLPSSVPRTMSYRINAGALDSNHWTMSPEEGGGRIIGEVCHFVDLLSYLAGAPVTHVYACAQRDAAALEQNVTATLSFANGSVANLLYTAQGNAQLPKEYIEVFAGGKIAILDDFSELTCLDGRRRSKQRSAQDKGFHAEMEAYVAHLRGQSACPIAFEESLASSLATIALVESFRSGAPVEVPAVSITAE